MLQERCIQADGCLQDEPPTLYPEYTEPGGTAYCHTSMDFWTSGFFPGILYLLLERLCKYPHKFHPDTHLQNRSMTLHPLKLRHACAWWSENMHSQATRSDTHDIGFMIQPWAQPSWELERSERAFQSMITAAKSLASRYDEKVGSLRSWDVCITKRYKFVDPTKDFLVIIDNMISRDACLSSLLPGIQPLIPSPRPRPPLLHLCSNERPKVCPNSNPACTHYYAYTYPSRQLYFPRRQFRPV